MKIIWLTTIFDDSAVSNILLTILPHFSSDISMTVVSLESTQNITSKCLATLQAMNVKHISMNCSKKEILQARKKLNALISDINPDIVHAQLGRAYIALLLSTHHKKRYCKVATFHNNAGYFNTITYYILKILFKKFDAVTAVSQSCLETIQHSFDKHRHIHSQVIYNPIVSPMEKTSLYKENNDTQEKKVVLLVVGRLVPGKGHDLWIQALPYIQKEFDAIAHTFELWCLGTGHLHASITKDCSQLGFTNQVKMLGHRYDVYELMQKADLVLFPSQDEGFGLVPCESILCGTPVLTQKLPVMMELLQNDAYMTDCNNPRVFAEKILHVFSHPDIYNHYIKESQKIIHQNFSIEKIANDYEQFYHALFHVQDDNR